MRDHAYAVALLREAAEELEAAQSVYNVISDSHKMGVVWGLAQACRAEAEELEKSDGETL